MTALPKPPPANPDTLTRSELDRSRAGVELIGPHRPDRAPVPATLTVHEDLIDDRPVRLGWWEDGFGFVLEVGEVSTLVTGAAAKAMATAILRELDRSRSTIGPVVGEPCRPREGRRDRVGPTPEDRRVVERVTAQSLPTSARGPER